MLTNSEQKKQIRKLNVYLVEQLMSMKHCSRDDALKILMKTTLYDALMDITTELYLESRESLLDILKEELAGNPKKLMVV